jgi:hypothetical protein
MGHPFCFGCPKENKDNSRSLRDDNKKGNGKGRGRQRIPFGDDSEKGKGNCNGEGNRRSFDFAQDDRVRRWGIGMEQRRKIADFSAALLTMRL